ncbi:MAG: hypothetical protein PHF80_02810 [Methanothrix sp.]|jgi:hypothetical protein|nr:hypothetical protein [Methanothrix sp.]
MASPTFSETYDSLMEVGRAVQRGLHDLGKIEGRNCEGSDEELKQLVLSTSKAILNHLPCLQLECDAIEHEDGRYCTILTRLENAVGEDDPEALSCQDQADRGLCGECQHQPCELREGRQ